MYGLHFARQTGGTKFATITGRKRRSDVRKERLEEVTVKVDRIHRVTTSYFASDEIQALILGPFNLLCYNVLIPVHSSSIPNTELSGTPTWRGRKTLYFPLTPTKGQSPAKRDFRSNDLFAPREIRVCSHALYE